MLTFMFLSMIGAEFEGHNGVLKEKYSRSNYTNSHSSYRGNGKGSNDRFDYTQV